VLLKVFSYSEDNLLLAIGQKLMIQTHHTPDTKTPLNGGAKTPGFSMLT